MKVTISHSTRRRDLTIRATILLLAGLLVATGSWAYTIVLKEGTIVQAREPYTVDGTDAVISLLNGSTTRLPIAEIDAERTATANENRLGNAVVVEGGGTRPLRRDDSDVSHRDKFREMVLAAQRNRQLRPREQEEAPLRQTAGGYPDLTSILRRPSPREDVSKETNRLLLEAGINAFKIFRGSSDERLLLEITTQSERDVFDALTASAQIFERIEAAYSAPALELLMLTPTGSRAGQFVLDAANAALLTKEILPVEDFFLEHVQY